MEGKMLVLNVSTSVVPAAPDVEYATSESVGVSKPLPVFRYKFSSSEAWNVNPKTGEVALYVTSPEPSGLEDVMKLSLLLKITLLQRQLHHILEP